MNDEDIRNGLALTLGERQVVKSRVDMCISGIDNVIQEVLDRKVAPLLIRLKSYAEEYARAVVAPFQKTLKDHEKRLAELEKKVGGKP